MSLLCSWTVHTSQGVHVWSLHGSILCTHWNILHLYILRKKDIQVLQAIVDYSCHLEKKNLSVDYKSHHVPASFSPNRWPNRKWTTNPFGIFGIRLQIPKNSSHAQLDPHISSGNGPHVWSAGTHLGGCHGVHYRVHLQQLWHNGRWLLYYGCVDHRKMSSTVCHCQ